MFTTLRLEALPGTRRAGAISIRLWTITSDGGAVPCGLVVMREEDLAALAACPPGASELASLEVTVPSGTVTELLEAIVGQDASAA